MTTLLSIEFVEETPPCPRCGQKTERVPFRKLELYVCTNDQCLGYVKKSTKPITNKEIDDYIDLGS